MSKIYEPAKSEFNDRFEHLLDEDDRLKDGAELPEYWQDDISEMADNLVPIYNQDRVKMWEEVGAPEIDDSGLIEGVTNVYQIIGVILYEQFSQELYELADRAGFIEYN